jgi:chromosome segregation ATPase
LIQTEDQFKIGFYFALKDTLVCADIEQAAQINLKQDENKKRRYRIVTTQGHLIE